MIVNPYNTSIGEMINIDPIVEKIKKYLVVGDSNLNYEYTTTSGTKVVFITGKNEEELSLPLWDHPVCLKDVNENDVVAVDIRKFVKIKDKDFLNLSSIIRDKGGFDFSVIRTLLIAEYLGGEYGVLRNVQKQVVTGFSYWISSILTSSLMFTPNEKIMCEIATLHYYYTMMVNGESDSSTVSMVRNKVLNSKLSLPVSKKVINTTLDKLSNDVKDMDDLVENIKKVIGETKASLVEGNVLINTISNSWYGPGSTETIIMSLENVATWTTMMFVSTNDNTYKRTRLATILNNAKSKIGVKDFISGMEFFLKDRTI